MFAMVMYWCQNKRSDRLPGAHLTPKQQIIPLIYNLPSRVTYQTEIIFYVLFIMLYTNIL